MYLFRLFLLLLGLSSLLPVYSQQVKAYFEQLTTVDGLPENSVHALLQDRFGFMWLGTVNGLVRYDGVNMTAFDAKMPYGLNNLPIRCLYEDRQGDIWVGGLGGVYRYEQKTQKFFSYSPQGAEAFTPKDIIYSVRQDKTGQFWVIYQKSSEGIRALCRFDPKTNAWIQYRHQPGNAQSLVFNNISVISATGVERHGWWEDAQGGIWVVTRNGTNMDAESALHRYDRIHDRFIPYLPKGIFAADPGFRHIKWVHFDRQKMMWLCTYNNGLFRINPVSNKIISHYRHESGNPHSLLCDTLRTAYEDRTGFLWLSSRQGLDRLDPKTGIFTHFLYDPNNIHSPHDKTLDAVGETANGHIWFLTTVGGLDEYNPKTKQFTRYLSHTGQVGGVVGRRYPSFLIDRTDLIWAGTGANFGNIDGNGLNKQSRMTRFIPFHYSTFEDKEPNAPPSTVVYEAPSDSTIRWIGTTKGLARYNKTTGKTTFYALDLTNPYTEGSGRITVLAEDAKRNFWVGTTNGVYLMDRYRGTFVHLSPGGANTANKLISSLLTASDGTLWIGTNMGLDQYNPETKQFAHYYKADTTYHPELFRFFSAINTPQRSAGIVRHSAVQVYQTQTFTLQSPTLAAVSAMGNIGPNIKNEYGWITDAKGKTIWEMNYERTRTAGSTLWDYNRLQVETLRLPAGTYTLHYKSQGGIGVGINAHLYASSTFYHPELWGIQVVRITVDEAKTLNRLAKKWVYSGLSSSTVLSLHQDKKGGIWIGNNSRRLDYLNPKTGKFTHYEAHSERLRAVSSIHEDPQGNLWLSDLLNGLFCFNPRSRKFKHYSIKNGLSHNSVMDILADNHGYLWLSTYRGVCRFDPKTQQFRTFTETHGLKGMIFRYPSFKDAKGQLFFLSQQGINTLTDGQFYDDPYPPQTVLTDIDIFNRKVPIGPDKPLSEPAYMAEKITLPHDQNDLTFHFSALYFNRAAECQYAVKLEPYDKDWVQIGTERQVRYLALTPGHYTFRVKAANADGLWNTKAVSIQVIIVPPWWVAWWAFLIYALASAGMILGFIRYRVKQLKLRQEVEFKHRETERLQAVDEMKTRFFTNITHEFRTPLSLIIGPTEKLLLDQTLSAAFRQSLNTVQRNARQLLHLINQLLDLSKLEAGSMPVTEFRGDIMEFMNQQLELIRSMAEDKQIDLHLTSNGLSGEYLFDAAKWERILSNLLTNAIKFTPPKGTVNISVRTISEKWTELSVSDTGIGIAPDKLPHVFDRFYQADDSKTRSNSGTGIGLALVRELTELMEGQVRISSELNKGTQVSVRLPAEKVTIASGSVGADYLHKESEKVLPLLSNPAITEVVSAPRVILVVEDHDELRAFIRESLSPEFQVMTATNGEEGWTLTQQELPDIVISDLMMPVMDGYELCQRIKTNPNTDHIAVVMLTARSSPEYRMEGFLQGADDYLVKPFNSQELQVRIHNRIAHRQKLQAYYAHQLSQPEIGQKTASDPFLEKIYRLLEDHLDDSSFGVDELAIGLAMSRRTLHRKLNSLLNLPASDLIQQYRLKRAAELLSAGQPVSQTAYQVGFESPQYFAKTFKALYHLTPTEFIHQAKA
ncbi:MAG: two-component regulator propeller domain-containing protein [Spirosomataceae bacterium]